MTYSDLKDHVSMLLTSENSLSKDDKKVRASIKFAYVEMADMTTPLKWLTLNVSEAILRQGPGSYFVRMPEIPTNLDDELDIDSELVPALARMIASYVSKEINLKQYHRALAQEMMKRYDAKVRAFILSQEKSEVYESAQYDEDGAPLCTLGI